jgi:succinoglycan biosynthesis transport protein ExoP
MRIGLTGPQDVLALLIRRKWWVIFPFVGLSCAVAILTNFLPKIFVSETLILVRPRDVPEEFVKDLLAGSAEQRLRAIEQTILSRTNLIQILREFGDQMPDIRPLNLDARIVALRKQINISFELDKRDGVTLPLTYFRISYQSRDPELAQKIAEKLTTLFIEQDNRVRETQVFGTTEFLSSELDKVSEQLKESEGRLKEVKTVRLFELPDQRDSNLRTLDRLAVEKKTNAEALDRFTTIRLNLESQISQTPEMVPKTNVVLAPAVVAKNADLEDYRKAQREYDELISKYKPTYPDVQSAKARLDKLKEKIPPELLSATSDTGAAPTGNKVPVELEPNPLYQKLSAQLKEVKTELEIREKNKGEFESEILKYSHRVEATPKTEQDIAEVVRKNDDLKKRYDDLNNKLSQARLAESLESKSKGSQFVVVDPANYPLSPAKPDKVMVALAGAVACFVISILLAIGVDVSRQRVWTQSQVEALWGVPVLVDIPEIVTDSDLQIRGRKRLTNVASAFAGAAAWSVCLYVMYIKHDFILQHLDPVLQKLVYK